MSKSADNKGTRYEDRVIEYCKKRGITDKDFDGAGGSSKSDLIINKGNQKINVEKIYTNSTQF